MDPATRTLDLDDASLTENTRAAYLIEFIDNAVPSGSDSSGGQSLLAPSQTSAASHALAAGRLLAKRGEHEGARAHLERAASTLRHPLHEVDALLRLREHHRFMKGLFAWVGYSTVVVQYEREPRSAGQSKFSGWRLWNFALEGITSFSTLPLRSWTYLGAVIASLAFFYGTYIVARTLVFGVDVPGYASVLSLLLFFGGLQLIGLGVVGEYIGRIYDEAKGRPIYLVKRRYQVRRPRERVLGNRDVISLASVKLRMAQGDRQRAHAGRR